MIELLMDSSPFSRSAAQPACCHGLEQRMANWKKRKTLFVSGSAMVDEQGKCSFTACLLCEVKSACCDVKTYMSWSLHCQHVKNWNTIRTGTCPSRDWYLYMWSRWPLDPPKHCSSITGRYLRRNYWGSTGKYQYYYCCVLGEVLPCTDYKAVPRQLPGSQSSSYSTTAPTPLRRWRFNEIYLTAKSKSVLLFPIAILSLLWAPILFACGWDTASRLTCSCFFQQGLGKLARRNLQGSLGCGVGQSSILHHPPDQVCDRLACCLLCFSKPK